MGNNVGIHIEGTTYGNQIGDTISRTGLFDPVKGTGNIIAFSKEQGIVVVDNAATQNLILSNSIYSNGQLGIDLGNNGVTMNDNRRW